MITSLNEFFPLSSCHSPQSMLQYNVMASWDGCRLINPNAVEEAKFVTPNSLLHFPWYRVEYWSTTNPPTSRYRAVHNTLYGEIELHMVADFLQISG
jgi:hypothetical protein